MGWSRMKVGPALILLLALLSQIRGENNKTRIENLDNHVRFAEDGELYFNCEIQHMILEIDMGDMENAIEESIRHTEDDRFREVVDGSSRWTGRYKWLQRAFNVTKVILGEKVIDKEEVRRLPSY